jgi:hypothetical protein
MYFYAKKALKKFFSVILAVFILASAARTAHAGGFADVPQSNFFHTAVIAVTNAGLMSGTNASSFGVNTLLSKFEAAVVFAKAAGFLKESAAEQERIYAKHSQTINNYAKNHANWNRLSDYEIAYLLEKGVMIPADLGEFYRTIGGSDVLRALSKEEMCVYLVRLIGKEEAAKAVNIAAGARFGDDSAIETANRPYIYYLKGINVVSGDTDGNFSPKAGATKGMLALLLHRVFGDLPVNRAQADEKVTGVIARVYPAFRALHIEDTIAGGKVYPVANDAKITVNGRTAAFSELVEGMEISAVSRLEGIVSIDAVRASVNLPPDLPFENTGGAKVQTLEGTVVTASRTAVEVELRLLTVRGEIYTERRTYGITSSTVVLYNGETAEVVTAKTGDRAVLRVSANDRAEMISITEKYRAVNGFILERHMMTDAVLLTVADNVTKRAVELIVPRGAVVTRNNARTDAANLRIGDTFTAALEYETVLNMSAAGEKRMLSGRVIEIVISAKGSSVTIVDADNTVHTFGADKLSGNNAANNAKTPIDEIYLVKLGDSVSVFLDSSEVENIAVIR